MRRVRDAARYADQQPLSSGYKFLFAIAGSVAVAVVIGTIGLYALVSGNSDDRGAAAGVWVGFVAFLVMPTVLVIHFSNRYRARPVAVPASAPERPSIGWVPWLFLAAMALLAVGVWQVLSRRAATGVALLALAGAAIAVLVAVFRRTDGR